MKIFTLLTALIFFGALSSSAQEKSYIPNARQAVKKSRMQQPSYMDLTRTSEVKETPQEPQDSEMNTVAATRPTNYQIERPLAIDAPKRRGSKSTSAYSKLASNREK